MDSFNLLFAIPINCSVHKKIVIKCRFRYWLNNIFLKFPFKRSRYARTIVSITLFCKHKGAYWISSNIAIAIWTFLLCSPFSYRSSNFAIAKLSLLIPLLQFLYKFCRLAHGFFLYCFPYSYRSSNYCNSCRSFTLLKA